MHRTAHQSRVLARQIGQKLSSVLLAHLSEACNCGQLAGPWAGFALFPLVDRLHRHVENFRDGGSGQTQAFALRDQAFCAVAQAACAGFCRGGTGRRLSGARQPGQLFFQCQHSPFERGDIAAVLRRCFFQRLRFGTCVLARYARDFCFQNSSNIGHVGILQIGLRWLFGRL